MSWTAKNDTIKPIAALPFQAAGTGSIMEPQTEPAEKHWLHGGATNETSIVSWLHGEATNGARLHRKTGLVLRQNRYRNWYILVPVLKTGLVFGIILGAVLKTGHNNIIFFTYVTAALSWFCITKIILAKPIDKRASLW